MFNLDVEGFLSFVDINGVSVLQEEQVSNLETFIESCNQAMNSKEEPLVEDAIYDKLVEILSQVKSGSEVLSHTWSEDDETVGSYNSLLERSPMVSIQTIKSFDSSDLEAFISRMPSEANYIASYKINGHGIRVVYKDGYLVEATTRGRSTNGRIITDQVKVVLGEYNEKLSEYGLVELRMELALRLDRLEEARRYNPTLKSAFSAVSSLIRPSTTEKEVRLLDALCYGVIIDNFEFDSKEEEFNFLEECGFSTPQPTVLENISRGSLLETIRETIELLESGYEEFGYFCDGVVFEVSDGDVRTSMLSEGHHHGYNVALKVGVWSQDMYSGYVRKIQWKRGKNKLTPVALVSESLDSDDGVLTIQGNRVRNVPLYSPKNIIILDSYIGCPIYFRYGGEAGVVPCFADGRLLSDDVVLSMLEG